MEQEIDWEDIYGRWEEFPHEKLRLVSPAGGAERLWARKLSGGLYGLDNNPLHPHFRYMDIVCEEESSDPMDYYRSQPADTTYKLAHRRWVTQIQFQYPPVKDPVESLARRQEIWDKLSEHGRVTFFVEGVGHVDTEFQVAEEALVKCSEAVDGMGLRLCTNPDDTGNGSSDLPAEVEPRVTLEQDLAQLRSLFVAAAGEYFDACLEHERARLLPKSEDPERAAGYEASTVEEDKYHLMSASLTRARQLVRK